MGTVVGSVEDCREMFEDSAQTRITPFSITNQIGNPVAYKLVRVAGDGRLVPATDEEILEVNETDMHIASDARQTLGYLHAEELPSLLSQPESSEALDSILLLPDNAQPCTDQECHSSCLEDKTSAAEGNCNPSPSQLSSEAVNQDSVVKSGSRLVQNEFVCATSHKNNEDHILTEVDQDMGEPEHIDSSGNSSDDNNNNNSVPVMQGGAFRRKHQRAWTLSEVTKLVEGVSKYGAGKWSEIKKHSFLSFSYRTSVDLKDKWRNLLKTSFAQSPSNSTGSLKKHGSMHIPMQILFRVRELAEKQSQVPPLSKVVGDSNRKEKESRSVAL